MEIQPFGQIDPQNLGEYYEATIQIGEIALELDLNFEVQSVDESMLIGIQAYIESIAKLIQAAMNAISHDYDLGEKSVAARLYLEHHVEVFTEEETLAIFGTTNISKDAYLQSLTVSRIGVYPEHSESYAVIDVMFPNTYTDYLISVTFDDNQNISSISMES